MHRPFNAHFLNEKSSSRPRINFAHFVTVRWRVCGGGGALPRKVYRRPRHGLIPTGVTDGQGSKVFQAFRLSIYIIYVQVRRRIFAIV